MKAVRRVKTGCITRCLRRVIYDGMEVIVERSMAGYLLTMLPVCLRAAPSLPAVYLNREAMRRL